MYVTLSHTHIHTRTHTHTHTHTHTYMYILYIHAHTHTTITIVTQVPGVDIVDVVKSNKGHGHRWSHDQPQETWTHH